jgi:hypothetical protein
MVYVNGVIKLLMPFQKQVVNRLVVENLNQAKNNKTLSVGKQQYKAYKLQRNLGYYDHSVGLAVRRKSGFMGEGIWDFGGW